jgi:hypothetical protein
LVFVFERRNERVVEEEELNQRLSDEYIGFLKLHFPGVSFPNSTGIRRMVSRGSAPLPATSDCSDKTAMYPDSSAVDLRSMT